MSEMPTRPRTTGWLLAILAQLAFLGWLVAAQERTLAAGERVVLAIAPVDPFDPLSGRYLAIRVALARLNLAEFEAEGHEVVVGADVPAAEPGGEPLLRFANLPAALELATEGSPRAARRLLIGAAAKEARAPFLGSRVLWSSGGVLELDLGLDRYYIPGDAEDPTLWWNRATERPAERPMLTLAVRVTAAGKSAIEELLVDGVPYPEWNQREQQRR
ncbi:MAG: GDYXXLXY domain-containing protein [Planctomycetes bacterium]|nr:GDYXXLXY domain-containing protein [Planctomycetota bacterium]